MTKGAPTKQWDKDINLECHAEYSTTKKPYTLSRHVSKLIVITAIEEDEDDDSYNVLDGDDQAELKLQVLVDGFTFCCSSLRQSTYQ